MCTRSNILVAAILSLTLVIARTPATITSNPSGARVIIAGNEIGRTPIETFVFTPGPWQIQILLEGYAPIDKVVTIHQARHLTMDFRLSRLIPVTFKTKGKYLEFELNGQRWEAPKIRMRMEEGEHVLKVYRLGILVTERIMSVHEPMTYVFVLDEQSGE